MSRYAVTAERTPRSWVLQAVEAPGAISQVKRLDQADVVKEAISFVTAEPEESIEIDLRPVGIGHRDHLQDFLRIRRQAEEVTAELQEMSRLVAAELVGEGLSYRDAATLMGLSYQRVGQLVGATARPTA